MTYTATFRQPRAHLNPANLTIRAPVTVELFQVGTRPPRWHARTVGEQGAPGGAVLTVGNQSEDRGARGRLTQGPSVQAFRRAADRMGGALTYAEQLERDTAEIERKHVAGPRDNYGMKGPGV